MMKKEYMKPRMKTVEIKSYQQLLAGSVKDINGNGGLDLGGGGTGTGDSTPHAPGLFEGDAWDTLLGE